MFTIQIRLLSKYYELMSCGLQLQCQPSRKEIGRGKDYQDNSLTSQQIFKFDLVDSQGPFLPINSTPHERLKLANLPSFTRIPWNKNW